MNDPTNAFIGLRKKLVDSNAVGYQEFRATCQPMRLRATVDFGLSLTIFVFSVITSIFFYDGYLFAVPLMIIVGLSLHKLSLFFHEAAHFNLITRSSVINDRVANSLIGIFLLDDIKNYRNVHLGHHRFFGKPNDPENTYQEPLKISLLIQLLLGVRTIKVLIRRSQISDKKSHKQNNIRTIGVCLYGVLVVLIFGVRQDLIAGLIVFGGIFSIFPFVAGMRQLLEHRLPPVGVTRVFAENLLAPILSGVGFSYHLYHHWDPQLHYTTLPKIHSYLLKTQLKDDIELVSPKYSTTILELWGVK